MSNETLWVLIGFAGLLATFAGGLIRRKSGEKAASARENADNTAGTSAGSGKSNESAAQLSQDLRLLVLQTPLGLGAAGQPLAIVMDIAYPEAVASVMASASGDASIYFSTGGGIIGGVHHESVSDAAKTFVRTAALHVKSLPRVSSYPFPTAGNVRFYVRAPETVYLAEAGEQALGEGNDPLSPLFYAGQEVITQLRLRSGDSGLSQRLINAVQHGDTVEMAILLSRGADPSAVGPTGVPPIVIAVTAKQTAAVELLLRAGASADTRHSDQKRNIKDAPLVQFAAANGSVDILRCLVSAGASLEAADATGLTPLMAASFAGNDSVVDLLLESNVNTEARDEMGYTALMFACNSGKVSVIVRLIEAGADTDARDLQNSTPLMFAAQHGYDACVDALLTDGADPDAVGDHGLSPITLARQNGHVSTVLRLAAASKPRNTQ